MSITTAMVMFSASASIRRGSRGGNRSRPRAYYALAPLGASPAGAVFAAGLAALVPQGDQPTTTPNLNLNTT